MQPTMCVFRALWSPVEWCWQGSVHLGPEWKWWPTVWMDSDGLNEAGMCPESRKPVMQGLRKQCPGRERGVTMGGSDPLAENGHGAGTRQAEHVCEHAHACSQLQSYTYIDSHMLAHA